MHFLGRKSVQHARTMFLIDGCHGVGCDLIQLLATLLCLLWMFVSSRFALPYNSVA